MRIEHIAMYVNELEKTRDFFIKYFNAVSNEGYHNQKTGLRTYFLSFEDGTRLEIMNRPELENLDCEINHTGYIHIAFSVGSKDRVDSLTSELEQAGYKVLSPPRTTGDGYYESCILGPEDNQIEITA